MHLRNVEIFCDVVALRSFSKAADVHNVSQSSASQAVHMLEKRLGSQLIDRSKRPLELTPAGQVYYDGCRELLVSFRKIEDRVQQMRNKVVGRVRIAAIYSAGLSQLEAHVTRFEELYPDVELHLEYLHPDEVYERVQSDEADLGLVSFPRDGGEFACIPWQEQEMVLVVPPAHRLAGRASGTVSELDGEDFVGFTAELTIRKNIDRWLRQRKTSVNVVVEFDNIETIKRAVEIGSGVAILPRPTVSREVESGSLRAVAFNDAAWSRPLGIVHRRHKALSAAATKWVELLREEIDDRKVDRKPPGNNGRSPHRLAAGSNGNGSKRRALKKARR
jgi:DNA-binding transcriptional LysR family regulator